MARPTRLLLISWIFVFVPCIFCRINPSTHIVNDEISRISVRSPWMQDEYGRVMIFHGLTSVSMESPYYFSDILNTTRLKLFQEWGLNVVRLGTMWSGIQPTEGTFNTTYIGVIKSIVQKLRQHGIYALLDMHQDVMSSMFDSYDGFPLWLVKKFPPPRHPFPWPLKSDPSSAWFDRYFTEAVSEAFQHLYDNTAGTKDHLAALWTFIAKVFRNETNVLGYELINEPWYGDMYAHPKLFLAGEAGRHNLMPLYETLNSAIRKVDPDTVIFYEPVVTGVTIAGKYLGTGFDHVPGGPDYKNRSVLSYHYYCNWITPGDAHKPYPFYKRVVCDDLLLPNLFTRVKESIAVTGGGSLLSEFGACFPDGQKNSTYTIECNAVMDGADHHLQSWINWDSAFFTPDGHINMNTVRSFSRTYARATSGTPQSMRYDVNTAVFTFSFVQDPNIKKPTEIFVPKFRYPGKPVIKVSSGFVAKWDPSTSVVYITPRSNKSKLCNVRISSIE